jgi:hypothetical protein
MKQKISEIRASISELKVSIERIVAVEKIEGMVKDSSISLTLLNMMAQLAEQLALLEESLANQEKKISALEKKVK